jgi:uncharacterized protein YdeI (YjbR/CyaY-like superfamily)
MKIIFFFFRTALNLREWFGQHHATAQEPWVGYYKTSSRKPSITWPESVDEALCVGWIDGIRKRMDDLCYTIRFTPRRPGSIWSAVNIKQVQALSEEGRMQPAGSAAFQARKENKSGIYSYEQRSATLVEPYATRLRQNAAAWAFFQAQPASYQKAANWWVVSAKQEATRLRRLEKLVEDSVHRRTIPQFTRRTATK